MTLEYARCVDRTRCIYRDSNIVTNQVGGDDSTQKPRTLSDLFLTSCDQYRDNICLGARPVINTECDQTGQVKLELGRYEWLTYHEAYLEATNFSRGLVATCRVKPRDRIAIYAESSREWLLSCHGCFLQNLTVITCYASLGTDELLHCLAETKVSVVIADRKLVRQLLPLATKLPHLKYIILLDGPSNEEVTVGRIQLVEYKSVLTNGTIQSCNFHTPVPEDTAFIMYTSGSTGLPKGVIISHHNVMSALWGIQQRVKVTNKDVYMGYLPLAHILELIAEHLHLMVGASIGYGSPHTLTDKSVRIKTGCTGDSTELRPTLMAAVPAVLDRIRDSVLQKMNGNFVYRWLFNRSYRSKRHNLNYGDGVTEISWYQRLFLSQIKYNLGGQVRAIISGGAPLCKETQEFMRICFDIPILQGYGLTESCAAGTITYLHESSCGRVGGPLHCNYLRLVDWEEGGYLTSDIGSSLYNKPRGEIYLGGDNIAQGYFNNPDKTAQDFSETIDTHTGRVVRWFHTGDIGQIYPDGSLEIIDRCKDLVKLTTGEYVSLAKVEGVCKLSPYIANIMVYAPVLPVQQRVVAIITVTDAEGNCTPLQEYARENGLSFNTLTELCQLTEINKLVYDNLVTQCQYGWLQPFETPIQILLSDTQWTVENGLVTSSLKLRRGELAQHYAKELSEMCSK